MFPKAIPLCVFASLVVISLAGIGTSSAPVLMADVPTSHAVPTASAWVWDGKTGFDWDARENHTHVVVDAGAATSDIALDDILTPFLDIEILGLPADSPVVVESTGGRLQEDSVYPNGRLVVWHVLATPMTITVTETVSGRVLVRMATTYLASAPDALESPMSNRPADDGRRTYTAWARPCGDCGTPGQDWADPYAHTSERTTAPAYVNGARSFTPAIRIQVDSCWRHVNSISFVTSGGYAAAGGTAGGTSTYTQEVCGGISSVGGKGQIAGPHQVFRKDTYRDNSWKVYALSPSLGFSSVNWDWMPARCCYLLQFQNCATNNGQYYSLREANSGAVHWGAAYQVFGVAGSASTTSADDNEANVRFECVATDDAFHHFTMYVVTGDGTTSGMVGAVWQDS